MLFSIASIVISYGILLDQSGEILVGSLLFLTTLALAILAIHKKTSDLKKGRSFWRNTILFILLPGLCASGAVLHVHDLAGASLFEVPENAECYFKGRVLEAKMARYAQEALCEVEYGGIQSRCRIMVYLPADAEIVSGQVIHFTRMPRFIRKNRAPGHFAQGLLRKGVCGTITLSRDEFTVEDSGESKMRTIFRKNIAQRLERVFSNKTASLLKGLYFGNKNHINKEIIQDFTWAGVLHILAASGAHLATLVFLPLAFFSFFPVDRRISFLAIGVIVALYLWITDMPVSLLRAFAMFIFGGLHLLFDADRKPLNILFHAASWILIFAPWELYQLGFQLTFGATLGILLFYGSCKKTFSFLPKWLSIPIALTISAQSLVYPVLALQLGEINLVSVISNLVIVPLVQFIFAGSLVVLMLDAILPFSIGFAAVAIDRIYELAQYLAGVFATLPGHFSPRELSPLLLVPWMVFIIPCLPFVHLRFIKAAALPVACVCAWVLLFEWLPSDNKLIFNGGTSNAAITFSGSQAVITGELSSMEEAREIVRVIKHHRVRSVVMALKTLDYKCAPAALYIAKNTRLVSFTLPNSCIVGRYLEALFNVLERDGVKIAMQSQSNTHVRR